MTTKTISRKVKSKKDDKVEKTDLNKTFSLSIPLEKVSVGPNGEVFVEGFLARVDTPDKTPGIPEQMDETLSTPNFEKWVHDTQERSNGLSLFNAREMHSAKAAGRGVEFKIVPGVGYWGKSEVVDADTKEKVLKGVITSHSIGGHYGQTWLDKGVLHYEAKPIEVSYVDVPMIPGTEFQFQNADGSTEMRKFASVAQDPEPEKQTAKSVIAKYAGLRKEDGSYGVDQDYARQESWDIANAAQAVQQIAYLLSNEVHEPEDAKELAAIIAALLAFMAGENKEMVAAATGTPAASEGEAESPETEIEEVEQPKPDADKDGTPEAEKDNDEPEEEPEDEPEMSVEKVREIVRTMFAEMQSAEKAERAGELAKANSLIASKTDALEKSVSGAVKNFEKVSKDLSGDIAKVAADHNKLETHVTLLQKTVDAYGPVLLVTPQGPVGKAPEGMSEKDFLKGLLSSTKPLSPQIRQAYQARLTELEIKEIKPLEEPPSFV